MSAQHTDIIDQMLSITQGSRLDGLRRHREVARDNIQKAYTALFQPASTAEVSLLERFAIASFVSGLHGQLVVSEHYAHLLSTAEGGAPVAELINAEIERGTTEGPYGIYPAGPLSAENKIGLHYKVAADHERLLGRKIAAALEHAHLLTLRPRDASREALQALLDAGWSTSAIVTISQLVAYLAFQVRIVEGLAALAAGATVTTPATSFTAALAAGAHS
jgi:CMD domain protein